MSWLARSIANSLNLDEDAASRSPHNDEQSEQNPPDEEDQHRSGSNSDGEDETNGRGVKEDLSELKDSFTRQFWGVASFLAPPPPPPPPPPLPGRWKLDSVSVESEPDRSGSEDELDVDCSINVGEELSRDCSESEDCEAEAVGITEEVLTFAMNIAHHPETWLDFPLEEEEFDGQKFVLFSIGMLVRLVEADSLSNSYLVQDVDF